MGTSMVDKRHTVHEKLLDNNYKCNSWITTNGIFLLFYYNRGVPNILWTGVSSLKTCEIYIKFDISK